MVDKSSEALAFFSNVDNKHLSEEEIFALNSLNCVGIALESRVFGLFLNNWDDFLDGAVLLVKVNQTSCEFFLFNTLNCDLEGEYFKINLNSENGSTCGSHENVIDESKAERFLGDSDQWGTLPFFVAVEEVFVGNVEVGVSFQVVFIDSLEAEDEHLLKLVKSVVVKGNGLEFSERDFLEGSGVRPDIWSVLGSKGSPGDMVLNSILLDLTFADALDFGSSHLFFVEFTQVLKDLL